MSAAHARVDYRERLARVVAHIHDHLEADLSLERLAEVAQLSPHHWHRIYQAVYRETLADTVRRLRLQRGAALLANTGLPVEQVARKSGYPNAQSFTRAFRSAYGASPSAYRTGGGHAAFRAAARAPAPGERVVQERFVPAVRLAGLDHRGSYMQIGRAFETSLAHLAAAGGVEAGTRWLAVFFDDPFAVPESQLASRAGLSLPPGVAAPAPLREFELGGCECAVLRYRGPYADMRAAYEWLYGTWLVESGRSPADAPVFEEYLNSPRETAPADLLTDIFLPLE
jgi:AraC family transcriptional regulator